MTQTETNSPFTSWDLLQIAHRLQTIMDEAAHSEDTAEILELDAEAERLLDTLADEVPQKLEALRAVALRLDSEAEMLRKEEKALASRRRAAQRAIARIKLMAAAQLVEMRERGEDPKVKTQAHSFWLASSTAIVGPENISAWQEQGWVHHKIEPDKTAAKKALTNGTAAPEGFLLEKREGIRWR